MFGRIQYQTSFFFPVKSKIFLLYLNAEHSVLCSRHLCNTCKQGNDLLNTLYVFESSCSPLVSFVCWIRRTINLLSSLVDVYYWGDLFSWRIYFFFTFHFKRISTSLKLSCRNCNDCSTVKYVCHAAMQHWNTNARTKISKRATGQSVSK